MSMVTRCPNCSTSFRINSAQLKAHHGTVRCGTCSQVFNAFDSLSTFHEPAEAENATVPREEPIAKAPAEIIPPAPLRDEPAKEEPIAKAPAEVIPPPQVHDEPAKEETVAESPEEVIPPAPLHDEPAPPIHEEAAAFEYAPLSFDDEKKSSWLWIPAAFLMLLLLCAQLSYLYRTELWTVSPGMRNALGTICRGLGCNIPLPRHADLIGIESSGLAAIPGRPGFVSLAAQIRNTAPYPQAFPLVDLTLTDSQDAPAAKRTFTPQEYLPKKSDFSAGIAANGTAEIKLILAISELQAIGYRLYLYYP